MDKTQDDAGRCVRGAMIVMLRPESKRADWSTRGEGVEYDYYMLLLLKVSIHANLEYSLTLRLPGFYR